MVHLISFSESSIMAFNLNSLLDSAGGLLGLGGDPFLTPIGQKVRICFKKVSSKSFTTVLQDQIKHIFGLFHFNFPCYKPFFNQLVSLCEYRHNTAFYNREKLDIWDN